MNATVAISAFTSLETALVKAHEVDLTIDDWREILGLFAKEIITKILPKISSRTLLDVPMIISRDGAIVFLGDLARQGDVLDQVDSRFFRTKGVFFSLSPVNSEVGPIKQFFGVIASGEWIEGTLFLSLGPASEVIGVRVVHVGPVEPSMVQDPISRIRAIAQWVVRREAEPLIVSDLSALDFIHLARRFAEIARLAQFKTSQ